MYFLNPKFLGYYFLLNNLKVNYNKILKLKEKNFFTINDVTRIFEIDYVSAKVLCSRYTKKGIFLRLKKNFYVVREEFKKYSLEKLLAISNYLQVPSYVSFITAISYYGLTTQIQRSFFENISLKRSRRISKDGCVFNYYKVAKKYYFGFMKVGDIFIATKEKALIDILYFASLGKYKFDISAIDLDKFDKKKIKQIIKIFPDRTKKMSVKYGIIG